MGARITVLGSSHLSSIVAALWLGWGRSVDHVVLEADSPLLEGRLPVREPGLAEFLAQMRSGGRYCARLAGDGGVRAARGGQGVLHVAEDVRVDPDGSRDDRQLQLLRAAVAALQPDGPGAPLVLVSSQVEVGTAEAWREELTSIWSRECDVVSWPENFQLGTAFDAAREMREVVIGADGAEAVRRLRELLPAGIELRVLGSTREAEFYKHSVNALLSTLMTFGNELAALCRMLEISEERIVAALRSERRFGPRMPILGGPPVTAPTLLREVATIAGLEPGRPSLAADVLTLNRAIVDEEIRRVLDAVGDRSMLLVGVGYKPEATFPHTSFGTRLLDACGHIRDGVYAFHPGFEAHSATRWSNVTWVAEPDDLPAVDVVVEVLPELGSTIRGRMNGAERLSVGVHGRPGR